MPASSAPISARCRPVTPIGIASKLLRQLIDRYEDQTGQQYDPEFAKQLQRTHALVGGLEPYAEQQTSPPSRRLAELAEHTAAHDWKASYEAGNTSLELEQEMLSGHAEGEFLKMLVSIASARSVLEIGMFTGYGTLAMAEALPKDGQVVALEYDEFVADFASRFFQEVGVSEQIRVMVGPAEQSLQTLIAENASFDFVFIDADKSGYREYLQTLLASELLNKNALICVDNTLLQGEPYVDREAASENGRAIAEFNEFVAGHTGLHHVMIPIRDGVTLIRRQQDDGES